MRPRSATWPPGIAATLLVCCSAATFGEDLAIGYAGRYDPLDSDEPTCSLEIEKDGAYTLTCEGELAGKGHTFASRGVLSFGWKFDPARPDEWRRLAFAEYAWNARRAEEEALARAFMNGHFAEH